MDAVAELEVVHRRLAVREPSVHFSHQVVDIRLLRFGGVNRWRQARSSAEETAPCDGRDAEDGEHTGQLSPQLGDLPLELREAG